MLFARSQAYILGRVFLHGLINVLSKCLFRGVADSAEQSKIAEYHPALPVRPIACAAWSAPSVAFATTVASVSRLRRHFRSLLTKAVR